MEQSPDYSYISVLVLDDKPEALLPIEKALLNAGVRNYRLFTDENLFLESLGTEAIVAVIDYMLNPDSPVTGVDICREVKKRNRLSWPIIMSAQERIEILAEFFNVGAKKYVMKWEPNYAVKVAAFVCEGLDEVHRSNEYEAKLLSYVDRLKKIVPNEAGNDKRAD